MTTSRFLLDVRPRDADAPGFHDLHLDADQLMRAFRSEPCLDRLCRKTGMTRSEVLKAFTPGAYADPATGEVSINAGYDPGFDEGALEAMIWSTVSHEVGCALAGDTLRAKHPHIQSKPRADDGCRMGRETRQRATKRNHRMKP